MIRKNALLIGLILWSFTSVFAKEGMWLPTLLNKYNINEMQQMGFKLTAEDIYSVNQACMKDAVVLFGTGCTGEIISDKGLMITNHHCGYSFIQNHSSLEHDYLTNGFWAKSNQEELPNPGLTVRFLERMEDVTGKILAGTEGKSKDSIAATIVRNTQKVVKIAAENGKFDASVQTLFNGNQYFLYVYQVFEDVRLVGAPPSAVGKFGGDTDNWMWPRHTGDFSLFRIYANKDNQPAKYSKDNVPYKPKKFLEISIKGVKPEDFTMVFGFPGRTQQFLPTEAIRQIMQQGDPDKIKIRDFKLAQLSTDMNKDALVRIQYSAKYASTSNQWKKWQGEIKGLRRLNALDYKQKFEADYTKWVNSNPDRQKRYGQALSEINKLYALLSPYTKANDYYTEVVVQGTDIYNRFLFFETLANQWDTLAPAKQQKIQDSMSAWINGNFKNYNRATDEKVFAGLMKMYAEDMDPAFLPEEFKLLMNKITKEELIGKVYQASILSNQDKLASANLGTKMFKQLRKDPVFKLFENLKAYYKSKIEPNYTSIQKQIDEQMKTYVAGILEMNQGKSLWPDANKTLRVSYGKVEGYEPMDGVSYDYYTTLDGIMQKDNPKIYDYNVPQKLRDLYQQKDYGRYGKDGKLNVCFIASNHTTGGNSGSPVLDANGRLIGVNFDRCWEGTMSDIMFDPDRCRNIILDMRYALFVIDKLSGAGYLLDEMKIVE